MCMADSASVPASVALNKLQEWPMAKPELPELVDIDSDEVNDAVISSAALLLMTFAVAHDQERLLAILGGLVALNLPDPLSDRDRSLGPRCSVSMPKVGLGTADRRANRRQPRGQLLARTIRQAAGRRGQYSAPSVRPGSSVTSDCYSWPRQAGLRPFCPFGNPAARLAPPHARATHRSNIPCMRCRVSSLREPRQMPSR